MDGCIHIWQPDDSPLFQNCFVCGSTQRIRDICPQCYGTKTTQPLKDKNDLDEWHYFRRPCGNCDATGYVDIKPYTL